MVKRIVTLIVLLIVVFSLLSVSAFATEPENVEIPESVKAVKEFTSVNGNVLVDYDVSANGCDGAIYAHDGANVTINSGNIHGIVCKGEKCDGKYLGYAMAV